jgi:hypothetical protein
MVLFPAVLTEFASVSVAVGEFSFFRNQFCFLIGAFFQLLETGFFHADPHPGNLLVTQDGRLALIDFGLMADVPIQVRVLNYFFAFVFASVFLKLSY